jgi:hypothetical protein
MNSMTTQDWEEVDASSRYIVSCLLSAMGATDISESHGLCCYDLSANLGNVPTSVEVKSRNVPHSRYNDVMIEEVKAQATMRKQQFGRRLAVNVYADDFICIANIADHKAVKRNKFCKYTTLVKGEAHDYVQKEVVLLPKRATLQFFRRNGRIFFKKVQ